MKLIHKKSFFTNDGFTKQIFIVSMYTHPKNIDITSVDNCVFSNKF